MNEIARKTLSEIIARHARPPELDVRQCEGLLLDYLHGEYKKEINVLVSAYREQVVADLVASGGTVPAEVLLTRCARKLHDQTGIAEEFARWSVESWALALGIIAPESIGRKPGLYIDCSCGKKMRVPEKSYGRRVRCPRCHRTFTAPGLESPPRHASELEPLPADLEPTNSVPQSPPLVSPRELHPAGLGVFVAAPPSNPFPISSPLAVPVPITQPAQTAPIPSWFDSLKQVEEVQPAPVVRPPQPQPMQEADDNYVAPPRHRQETVLGITSLVISGIGALGSLIPCFGLFAIPFSIIGLVLGVIGLAEPQRGNRRGIYPLLGLVVSIVGLVIDGFWFVLIVIASGK